MIRFEADADVRFVQSKDGADGFCLIIQGEIWKSFQYVAFIEMRDNSFVLIVGEPNCEMAPPIKIRCGCGRPFNGITGIELAIAKNDSFGKSARHCTGSNACHGHHGSRGWTGEKSLRGNYCILRG
jgi:hypothetical protein